MDERDRLHIAISLAADEPRPNPDNLHELSIRLAELECEIAEEQRR